MSNPDSTGVKRTGEVQVAGIGIVMPKADTPDASDATETTSIAKKRSFIKILLIILGVMVVIIAGLVFAALKLMGAEPTFDKVARANGLDSSQEFNVALGRDGVLTGYTANTLVIWEDRRGDAVAAALILPDGKIIPNILITKSVIVLVQTEGGSAQARFQLEDGWKNRPDGQATISGLVYYGTQRLTIFANPATLNQIAPIVS